MFISKEHHALCFENKVIPVEFVVIHYTAQSIKKSLDILTSDSSGVSCHLLIDEEGKVYELVDCWEGKSKKAFHSGNSLFVDSQNQRWKQFNNFSLGIEIVNWNGNIFPYKKNQYQSLFKVLLHLKSLYPQLQNPDRIVGHEHISGFRGKKDPGLLFDWSLVFKNVYPSKSPPQRQSVFTKKQQQFLSKLSHSKNWNDNTAKTVSRIMEMSFLPFWLKKLFIQIIIS